LVDTGFVKAEPAQDVVRDKRSQESFVIADGGIGRGIVVVESELKNSISDVLVDV